MTSGISEQRRRRHRWLMVFVVVLGTNACVALPDVLRLDVPDNAVAIPEMPDYGDPIWMSIQGLPLRRAWLAEGRTEIAGGEMYVLPHVLTGLPYKNDQETEAWVDHINSEYAPDPAWVYDSDRRIGHYKCMSTTASTIIDWFLLDNSQELPSGRSLLNGQEERGFDHRALDALYFQRATDPATAADYPLFDILPDPVEGTGIPFDIPAFNGIITMTGEGGVDPETVFEMADPSLPGVSHRLVAGDLPPLRVVPLFEDEPTWVVEDDPERFSAIVVAALEEYGPLFVGLRFRFATSGGIITANRLQGAIIPDFSTHGVVVVGYIRQHGRTYFIYREVFGEYDEGWADGGPAYRVFPVHSFQEAWAFERVELPGN